VVIHNGDQGFEITFRGTHAEDPKDLREFLRRRQFSLEVVLRRWLNELGVALFYEGLALVEAKQAHRVTVLNASDQAVTLLIDTGSYLPIKKSYSWRDEQTRERNQEEEIYDLYRLEQGINTPHSITRIYNGDMASQRFIRSVSYNLGLADSLFQATVGPGSPGRKK